MDRPEKIQPTPLVDMFVHNIGLFLSKYYI